MSTWPGSTAVGGAHLRLTRWALLFRLLRLPYDIHQARHFSAERHCDTLAGSVEKEFELLLYPLCLFVAELLSSELRGEGEKKRIVILGFSD